MSREHPFRSVTATTLVPPGRRPETISRERVHRLLDRARKRPLTIVSAPAGYGKTTALAEWCKRLDGGGAWLSLHDQDNDPQRLLAHVVAAIDRARPGVGWAAEQALVGGSDLVETVVPLVAGALADAAADGGLVLVLDDCHVIVDERCHRLLVALTDGLPAGVQVVVAGRELPPLRLGRHRAARTVTELDATDLAFDADEARQLLTRALRLRLDPGQVEEIRTRVEGWPAGLSLVAASLRADRDGDDVTETLVQSTGVAAYLVEEVLDAVAPPIRDFLRRTSVLPRMNPALCAAVLDDPEADELFDEVVRSNLFVVPVDAGGGEGWVRYHQLFAELLERDLRRHEPFGVARLHRRAAQWFEREGIAEDAIEHATAAGDGEGAARVLRATWWQLFRERRHVTVLRLLDRMPRDRGEFGPFCDALHALCAALEGADLRLVADRLDALEPYRDAPGVLELLEMMRLSPYYGDIGRAVAEGWAIWRRTTGDAQARARHAGKFATVLWFAGEREALHRHVVPYMGVAERPALRSWEFAALALSAADEGDAEAAELHALDAVAVIEAGGGESSLESHLAYVALAEALRRRGRPEEAHTQIARALRTTARVPDSIYHALPLIVLAQLDLASRDRRAARTHAAAARRIVDRYPDVGVLEQRLAEVEGTLELPRRDALRGSEPTAAELRVLNLLPTELTRRQIAEQLHVSVSTVKTHTRRLYRRLDASTREEAVAIARERGLL